MSFETRPNYHTRRRANQKKEGFSLGHIILAIFIIIGLYGYVTVKGVGNTEIKSGTYTIEKGATSASLPKIFGVDVSPTKYKIWSRFFAPSFPKLQAGTYTIESPTIFSEVIEKTLTKPTYTDLTITILPGWNMYDIDAYLSDKKIIETGAFLIAARDHFDSFQEKYPFLKARTSMEGFLYPDTYRILQTADAYMIIDRLLAEWQAKIGESYATLGADGYKELILASIVEREERKTSEKPIVADILAKRVKEGIPMGADATVCYEYAKTQKQCTPDFIASVITEKTPYNTRNKQGYPPTPISSISKDTWDAVMSKSPSPYYYYLHDSNGVIHYGKTLEEHNTNKQNYLD